MARLNISRFQISATLRITFSPTSPGSSIISCSVRLEFQFRQNGFIFKAFVSGSQRLNGGSQTRTLNNVRLYGPTVRFNAEDVGDDAIKITNEGERIPSSCLFESQGGSSDANRESAQSRGIAC